MQKPLQKFINTYLHTVSLKSGARHSHFPRKLPTYWGWGGQTIPKPNTHSYLSVALLVCGPSNVSFCFHNFTPIVRTTKVVLQTQITAHHSITNRRPRRLYKSGAKTTPLRRWKKAQSCFTAIDIAVFSCLKTVHKFRQQTLYPLISNHHGHHLKWKKTFSNSNYTACYT